MTPKEWAEWDKQIEADSKAGKLDFLIEEALNRKQPLYKWRDIAGAEPDLLEGQDA